MKKILLFMCALICSAAMSAATWNVTVPEGTKTCYIAGEATGWKHTEMTKVDATHYTITIETDKKDKYKYCSGPDWAWEELTAVGGKVEDRMYAEQDVVAKWKAVWNPTAVVTYVDITIRVKAATAPTIWWWGAGDKCPNPDQMGLGYDSDTNQPVMTAVEGKEGWFEWNFKDVNASLGVTFKLNKGNNEINAKESTCYNTSGDIIDCNSDDPVVTYDYYIAGNEALTGKNWVANGTGMNKVDGIYTYTFSNVAANTQCELKVTDGTWDNQWGYDQLSTVPAGVTRGSGMGNNSIIFTTAEAGDVTVQFNAETQKVTLIGTFNGGDEPTLPVVSLRGSLTDWDNGKEFVPAEDKLTASVVVTLEKKEYEFKVYANGKWLTDENFGTMTRDNCTDWKLVEKDGEWGQNSNTKLTADVAGNYTFTWTYANNSLSVTYPMAGPTSISSTEAEVVTTKVIRDGQVLIIRDGVVYNMMGQAIR